MALNKYQLIIDLSKSYFIDSENSGVPVQAGKELRVADQVAGDTFEVQILCYDDYDANIKHDFGASAVAKLYIKLRNSEHDPVTIDAAGTVTQSAAAEYDTVTFQVDKNSTNSTIGDCIMYGEVTTGTEKRTLVQYINIFSVDGTAVVTTDSEDTQNSVYQVVKKASAPDANDDNTAGYSVGDVIEYSGTLYEASDVSTAAAVWGIVTDLAAFIGTSFWLCDTTAGNIAVSLAAGGENGEIKYIKNDTGSNEVTISGTIENTTTILLEAGDMCQLIYDNNKASWINLNYTTVIF